MYYCLYKIKSTFKMGVFTFLAAPVGMKINTGCFISVQLQIALGLLTLESASVFVCVCLSKAVESDMCDIHCLLLYHAELAFSKQEEFWDI